MRPHCFARQPALLLAALATIAHAQPQSPAYNDGTDPANPTKTAALSFEHRTLPEGDAQNSLFADLILPLGSERTVLALRAPMVALPGEGQGLGLGDASIQLSRILPTGERGAIILGGQLELNTASSPSRGAGQTVASASMIVEHVAASGLILAPTITHSLGISGSQDRVNRTRINLYTVPAVASENLYLTVDPAITLDWGDQAFYPEIAATAGYRIGRLAGADLQLFLRSGAAIGSTRSTNGFVEFGLQLLNF